MTEIVGIQFKSGSRLYYFSPNGYKFNINDYAIVETVRGLELGKVTIANREVEDDEIAYELKPIIRPAKKDDIDKAEKYEAMTPYAFKTFKKYVSQLNLEMKPLYAEYTIDGSKVVFYYTADDRIDFRELLKLITPSFKCRVELRQISTREAARHIGGLGNCGRVICCKSCLNNADFVTMKMAKEQNMSLSKEKVNGLCDKLLCCIAYEHELYKQLKKELPEINQIVRTPNSDFAKVVSLDFMKKLVTVKEQGKDVPVVYSVNDLVDFKPANPDVDPGLESVVTSDEVVEENPKTNVEPVSNPKKESNDTKKKVYIVKKYNNNQGKKKK